ncbi:MAG: DUF7511 domain-containing protein [archaeon]
MTTPSTFKRDDREQYRRTNVVVTQSPNATEHMSAIGQIDDTNSAELDELPEFELCFLFDDQEDPEQVTIFRPGVDERSATRWLTIDSDHAVSLDQIR